ncbi:cytidine deaminase [Caldicellulosiruptoraceae bacterium PP1]
MEIINRVDENLQKLIDKAFESKNKAYAKYSKFHVGASVETDDGVIFGGCNIENASYGLTICAERVALFKAYSEGKTNIKTFVVVGDTEEPISPCGACRQVISELAPNSTIYLVNKDKTKIIKTNSKELLPYNFEL